MRHQALVAVSLVTTGAFIGLAVLGFGDRAGFMAHPARRIACIATVVLAVAASSTDANLSSGRREDVGNRWIFLPFIALTVLWAWLPPFAERHDLFTLDGDAIRWVGLALVCAGGVLRVWPMFVLGGRFSGLVAIQEQHTLQTTGLYRLVRHPSYLGGIVWLVGWMLLFRSGVGLMLVLPAAPLLLSRIAAEEKMLASEFGESYAQYRRRSYRLIPFVY